MPRRRGPKSRLNRLVAMNFELGTLYTMIAGLLNILAICDAYAGPFIVAPDDDESKRKKKSTKPPPADDKGS